MFTVTFGQCNASLLNKSIHFLWKTLLSYILQKYSMLGSAILNIASFLFLSIELTHTWQTFRVFSHSDHCFLLLSVKQPIQVVPHTSYLNHAWFMNTCTNTCKISQGLKQKKSWAWTFFWGLEGFGGGHTQGYLANKQTKNIWKWFSLKLPDK